MSTGFSACPVPAPNNCAARSTQLGLPLRDLVRVYIELACQLRKCPVAAHCGKSRSLELCRVVNGVVCSSTGPTYPPVQTGATSNTVLTTIAVGSAPVSVAVNPNTNRIYTVNALDDTVSVIDGATNLVIDTINVGVRAAEVVVNPATNMIFVANRDSNTVTAINGADNTVAATIPVGPGPRRVTADPVGNRIYIGNVGDGTVSVVDGNTLSVIDTFAFGDVGHLDFNPATNRLYSSGGGTGFFAVDGDTGEVVGSLNRACGNTLDVVVNPATDRVYVSNNCGFIGVIEDLAEIHGMKWDDLNADGVRDPGEPGLEGVRINLYALTPPDDLGDLFRATFTDADGNYSFLDVPPGFYRVEETPFGQTFPPDGQPHFIQLGQGEIRRGLDFGNRSTVLGIHLVPTGEIRGTKFNDENSNGMQDPGELGVVGVRICLQPSFRCTFTGVGGLYSFEDVAVGTQTVVETLPSGTINTTPRFQRVTVAQGEIVVVDFGNRELTPCPDDIIIPGACDGDFELPRGRPLTVQKTIDLCEPFEPPQATLFLADGTTRMQRMVNFGGGEWAVVFDPPFPFGVSTIRVDVDCGPTDTPGYPEAPENIGLDDFFEIADVIFVDPSGAVLNACTDEPIEAATVTLLRESPPGTGNFVLPLTTDHLPATNPLTTGPDGRYAWDVVPGTYKVQVEKAGFMTNEGGPVSIPPAASDLDVALTPNEECPGTITIRKEGDAALAGERFDFEGDLGGFSVTAGSSGMTFAPLALDDYTVTEAPTPGFDLVSAACEGADFTPVPNGVTIHLESGEHAICVFTNQPSGSSDTTPPRCEVIGVNIAHAPTPTNLLVEVEDTGSGLDAINGLVVKNAVVNIPAFSAGTNAVVEVVADKIDESKRARVEIQAIDVAGNSSTCDPVLATLTRGSPTLPLTGVSFRERYLTISPNGPTGSTVMVNVNGTWFQTAAGQESMTIDLGSAMSVGSENTVTLWASSDTAILLSDVVPKNASISSAARPWWHSAWSQAPLVAGG